MWRFSLETLKNLVIAVNRFPAVVIIAFLLRKKRDANRWLEVLFLMSKAVVWGGGGYYDNIIIFSNVILM